MKIHTILFYSAVTLALTTILPIDSKAATVIAPPPPPPPPVKGYESDWTGTKTISVSGIQYSKVPIPGTNPTQYGQQSASIFAVATCNVWELDDNYMLDTFTSTPVEIGVVINGKTYPSPFISSTSTMNTFNQDCQDACYAITDPYGKCNDYGDLSTSNMPCVTSSGSIKDNGGC